jgi:valyl-tRNA synthetase
VILKLSKTSELTEVGVDNPERTKFNWRSIGWADIAVVYDKQIDVAAERERLTKEVARLEKAITNSERQLTNQAFLEKAPPSVVEGLKKQEAENRQLLEKAKAALDTLPPDAA